MKKTEMADVIAEKAGLSKKNALYCINLVCELIADEIVKEGAVALHGVGTFKVKQRAARTAHNPRTGQKISVPARRVVGFRPASSLVKAVAAKK